MHLHFVEITQIVLPISKKSSFSGDLVGEGQFDF